MIVSWKLSPISPSKSSQDNTKFLLPAFVVLASFPIAHTKQKKSVIADRGHPDKNSSPLSNSAMPDHYSPLYDDVYEFDIRT